MEHQEFQSAPSDQSRRGQKFLNSVKRTGAKLSQKVRNRLQEHQKRSAVHPSNNSPSTSTELQHREFQSAPTGQHKRGKKFLKKLKKIQERFSNNRIRPVEEKQGTSGVDGVDTEEPETTSISGSNNTEHSTTKKRVHFEPTPPTSTEMESENTKDAPCDQQEERAENTCSETVQIIRAKVIQTSLRLLEEQDRRASVATVIMEEPESTMIVMDDSLWARVKSKVSKFPSIKEYAHRILENCFFSGFVTLMIVLSFLVVIVQSEISDRPHLAVASQVCSMLNWLIVATFYLEILLKMIVDFRQFWRNMWNIFDLIVTSLSVLPEIVTAFSGTGTQSLKIVKLIRTFRVLRALKITAKFRELRVTVLAVTKACKELVPVCVLLFFLMYMFAVTGSTLFRGYAQSDVQNLTYSKSFVGMSNTLSTLFILFTNNQCGSLLKEIHKVPELNHTSCYIYVILWVIIAFYIRNLMAGYVVNSCRTIRNAFMEEVSQIEIQKKADAFKAEIMSSRISLRTDITEDSAASNSSTSQDTDVDWRAKIMENMHVIAAQEQGEEVVWPRDTLIRFFEVMEKIQRKEEEVVRLRELYHRALRNMHGSSGRRRSRR